MDFITPHQFSLVEDGIYRGSYPTLRNFCFIERLQIKAIVSLIPESPTKDLQAFCQLLGIQLIHFQINRLTPFNNPNLQKKLVQAVSTIIALTSPNSEDKASPLKNIYVHCLDGRRISGLMVALLRRLQNYAADFIYNEYWKFQLPVRMPFHEELRMNRELERFVNEINEEFMLPSDGLPRYLWDGEPYKGFPTGVKASYITKVEKKSMESIALTTASGDTKEEEKEKEDMLSKTNDA